MVSGSRVSHLGSGRRKQLIFRQGQRVRPKRVEPPLIIARANYHRASDEVRGGVLVGVLQVKHLVERAALIGALVHAHTQPGEMVGRVLVL